MDIHMYLTSGEAAEYLQQQLKQDVRYYDLDNLIRAQAIDPPELIGGRRLWSKDDLREAAKALRIRRSKRPVLTQKRSTLNNE
jgi:triosephosphate isomerase